METNGVVDSGSRSEMRLPVNIARAPVEKRAIMTRNAGSSTAALAAAEARRKPVVRRDGVLLKRRRTKTVPNFEFVPPPLPPFIMNPERLVLLFYKKLQKSDVNTVGRTVLPKRAAEAHLPRLLDNQSVILPVIDMDGAGAYTFKFRYWSNNHSRMYVFEGTGPFTRKYGLEMGDYMLIYRDLVNWNYLIRGVKASEEEKRANQELNAVEETNADSVVLDDADLGALDLLNFPEIESLTDTYSMDDDSFFSDILNPFSSWDEIEEYYLSPTEPNASFGNTSSEDLSQV